jgi:hypothetical protein
MAMTGGIGYEIDQLAELGVPELMRKQSVDPQLKYALALQEATKMVEAAARERDMSQQMPMPADVVGQMETSLAKRLAPGVQQQGQRSMQMQNRAAMGIPGQPAPNMQRMADGGIVGYADGGMPKAGAQSKGPIPQMSPEENAQVLKYLEGLKKFDYYDKNPDKVSPEGRQALEAERRAFEAQFPNSFRQKVNEMMYGPSKGMAMGGTVKGYAGGGEIKAYLASMGRDIADFTQEQIAAISDMLDSQVARGQNDTLRQVGRGAMGLLRDRMPSMPENAGTTSEAARQFNRETMQARNERDTSPSLTDQLNAAQRKINAENSASMQDVMTSPDNKMGIASILGSVRDFVAARDPRNSTMGQVLSDAVKEDFGRVRDFVSERNPMNSNMGRTIYDSAMEDLGNLLGEGEDGDKTGFMQAVRNTFNPNLENGIQPRASLLGDLETRTPTNLPQNEGVTADMYDVRSGMPTDRQKLGSMVNKPSAVFRDNMAERVPQESGIRGLLQKAKPFADKAADIAEILGRGAGASKGFEFAKIAEESRRIDQAEQARQDEISKAEADRQMRKELLREEYGFRDKELRSKLLSESMAGEREADRELLETIMTNIESDPEFSRAAEEFKDTYDVFFGTYDKDKYAEALAKKRQELIEKRFNEAKGQLASVLGGSSSASAMEDLAKYNI